MILRLSPIANRQLVKINGFGSAKQVSPLFCLGSTVYKTNNTCTQNITEPHSHNTVNTTLEVHLTPSHDPGQSAVPLPSMCTFSLDHEARDDDQDCHNQHQD